MPPCATSIDNLATTSLIDGPFSREQNILSLANSAETNDEPETLEHRSVPGPEQRPLIDSRGRAIIYIDDVDYVTMHNLLYFLYTGYVNLHNNSSAADAGQTDINGYPDPVDAFSMYRAANMYLVEELEDRCYRYLVSTCSPENICERLLGNSACQYHDKIRDAYFEYLIQNYDVVKMSKEWEEMIMDLKTCTREVVEYRAKILLDISRLTFGVK